MTAIAEREPPLKLSLTMMDPGGHCVIGVLVSSALDIIGLTKTSTSSPWSVKLGFRRGYAGARRQACQPCPWLMVEKSCLAPSGSSFSRHAPSGAARNAVKRRPARHVHRRMARGVSRTRGANYKQDS